MESLDFFKWLTTQTDRGLFIIAIAALVWFSWRQNKRSEKVIDQLASDHKESREINHKRSEELQNKLFTSSEHMTAVVTANTEVIRECKTALTRCNDKLNAAVVLFFALLLAGCSSFKPPQNAVVGVTIRKIGIQVGENIATQTPEVTIGYYSITYHRVPTGTNIVAPAVRSGIRMDQSGFSTDIVEDFATGNAAVMNR